MHRVNFLLVLALLASLSAGRVSAADEPLVMKLWPSDPPGETRHDLGPEEAIASPQGKSVLRISNVSEPTISLYRPPAGTANGCGVVICPGGGYNILAYDLEGTEIAEWLNSIGVTAVVLKYRVPRRDPDDPQEVPLKDAQRAMRLVRKYASEWSVDPDRLGMLGFSAGGNLTVMTGTHWDRTTYSPVDGADKLSCRPDFLVPVYPAYLFDKDDGSRLSPLVKVNENTPPSFIVITHDDQDRAVYASLFYVALKRAGVPSELHVFSQGGHGYGLRPSENPVSGWPKLCEAWLRTNGLIDQ